MESANDKAKAIITTGLGKYSVTILMKYINNI